MNYMPMNFKNPLKLPPQLGSQIKSKSAFVLSMVSLFILILLFIIVTLAGLSVSYI